MRKKRVYKKHYQPDIVHDRVNVGRFINYLMRKGKKTAAEKIFYGALENIKKDTQKDPLEIFDKALENAAPLIQVISKRIGGANYQVPKEVRPERKFFLACQWIIKAAKAKKGKPMAAKLDEELGELPVTYLNRLSDALCVFGRWAAMKDGRPEPLWQPGTT